MFVDYGNKYLTPTRPKWNPPSRYVRPAKRKRAKPKRTPGHKKFMKPRVKKPRVPKFTPPQTQPQAAPARNPFRVAAWVSRFAKVSYRLSPHLRGLGYAWDIANGFDGWYSQPEIPETFTPAPGFTCYSYNAAIDVPSLDCDNGYHYGTFGAGGSNGADCNTWHYQNQALPSVVGTRRGVTYGPLRGGVYGCERMNYAHVWIYPAGTPGPAKVPTITPARPGYTTPLPRYQFDPFPDLPVPQAEPMLDPVVPMRPYEVPALEIDPENGKGPQLVRHILGLPLPGTREKKGVIIKRGAVARTVGGVFGNATEGLDLVNALHGALPKDKRTPYASQKQKLLDVWDNYDAIDWRNAALNIALDQAQDFLIGKINKKAIAPFIRNGPSSKYWVRPTAPGAGSRRWSVPVGL